MMVISATIVNESDIDKIFDNKFLLGINNCVYVCVW